MKSLVMIIVFFIVLNSCSALVAVKDKNMKIDSRSTWDIIDRAVSEAWSASAIVEKLGQANEVEPSTNASTETWIYYHKTTDSQHWSFELSNDRKVLSLSYFPSSDRFAEFSLEAVKKHWESFRCENKEKQTVFPDFIRQTTYLSCDKNKRYVEYNRYNEVNFLSVKK